MKNNTVNILDFGAAPNTSQLQTEKIQAAIDSCFEMGGGTVVVPEGTFMAGGIRLRSGITLHLQKNAILKGSRNPEDYFSYVTDTVEPLGDLITNAKWNRAEILENKDSAYEFFRTAGSRWNNALIRAVNAENISVIGEEGSVLDGSDCFDELGEENYRGPHCIGMFCCKNIRLDGYTIKDSANWAHSIFYSENLSVHNVTVLAGHDGIHTMVCRNITISDCHFYTGDDCVAGFSNINLLVKNCELNSACSAMRLGGTNVVVENCHIYGPCKYLFRGSLTDEEKRSGAAPTLEGHRNNMLSVFTYYSDFSVPVEYQPGNIIIRNCDIDYADRFLHFNFSGNEMWQANRPLESIRFENINATGISMPLTLYGDKDTPVTFELKNANISIREGAENIEFMHAANYASIKLQNVKIHNYKGDTLIKTWSDGQIEIDKLVCDINENQYISAAQDVFTCEPI
ncbi:MAG: hypothetical protein IKT39_06230 [Clostridia bacterium]|nr:hypothetical protein [Clostridia bacterium]MBR6524184.1 hypothetical protein [Clostridia bacterium]